MPKYGIWMRAPQELLDDHISLTHLLSSAISKTKKELAEQSKKWMRLKVEIGLNDDDFIGSLKTIRVMGYTYKIPNIVKDKRIRKRKFYKVIRFMKNNYKQK